MHPQQEELVALLVTLFSVGLGGWYLVDSVIRGLGVPVV